MSAVGTTVTPVEIKIREVEAEDPAKTVPNLLLGDLRELIRIADEQGLPDDASIWAKRITENRVQPGRYFVGTLIASHRERA